MPEHSPRKADHLDLCATDQVAFRERTNLLEQVDLVHDALPELALSEVDPSTELCGKRLAAPVVIAAMTGGLERAEAINRDLAAVAEDRGIGFAFGSMRPLVETGTELGYLVRDVAPRALVLGNIGVVQARDLSTEDLGRVVERAGCDALCVHLNPAMELIQPEGDRDFRGGLETIARLCRELPVPVVVKETGCGLSRSVGRRLREVGVRWVDTSGAGGTSWVGVESLRARREPGPMWDWGIPTAASVVQLGGLGLEVVATGGVSTGLDVARALALGAVAGGIARPFLHAWSRDGRRGADQLAGAVIDEVRAVLLLTGSRTVAELQSRPLVLGPDLAAWLPADSPLRGRLVAPGVR